MENNRNKNRGKKGLIFVIALLTVFCVSFSTSAWIVINANRLVFVDNLEEYQLQASEAETDEDKDAEIKELKSQVERYKTMYESVVKENKSLASSAYKNANTSSASSNNDKKEETTDKNSNNTTSDNKDKDTTDTKNETDTKEPDSNKNNVTDDKENESTVKPESDNTDDGNKNTTDEE